MNHRTPRPSVSRKLVASALAALATVLVAHSATVLVFFAANDSSPAALANINAYFVVSSLITLGAVFVLAFFGSLRRWFLALPAGVLAGVTAAVVGTMISVAQSGTPVTSQVLVAILGTLVGTNLLFLLAVIIATVTVGRSVWSAIVGSTRWAAQRDRVALVRLPAANLEQGHVTHIERVAVDNELADEQWDAYVDALIENGWRIVEVDAAPELADSVFVEDTMVVFGDLAVIASPGAESRRSEIEAAEHAARDLGLEIQRISLPGTLDGGDALTIGSTVYVGRGGRTNAEGVAQLRALLTGRGYTVVAVPISTVLHLKSAVTALPDGTVIGYPPLVETPEIFGRFLAVPEESGAHVVVLDDETLLMAASAPKSAELLAGLGYRIVTVDISEFEKLEGCVTCLSVRVR